MASKILVVEDDGLIRLDLVDTLSNLGFEVFDAANADQALAIMENEPTIHALLTDIDMPGSMNGLQLASLTAKRWPQRKIVVISGRYSPSQGSLPEGAAFLSKPVADAQLETAIQAVGISP